ncbi:hypothetical protein LTR12_001561 [Friedmanniomyces endolithicus]|nr:hypothetical protein LTR12_001561 [Friedmanniomyces endolithicus]
MLDFWTRGDRGASWDRWTRRWALRWGQRRRQVLRLSCPRDLCAIVLGHHGEPQLCLYWRAGIGVAELQAGVHRTASSLKKNQQDHAANVKLTLALLAASGIISHTASAAIVEDVSISEVQPTNVHDHAGSDIHPTSDSDDDVSDFQTMPGNDSQAVHPHIHPDTLSINCQGSWACSIFDLDPAAYDGSGTVLQRLIDAMQTMDASWQYQNGDHIACIWGSYEINVDDDGAIGVDGGICSFLQGTSSGVQGGEIKGLLQELQKRGCEACGSIPTTSQNDVSKGELTVNFVSGDINGCNGLCGYTVSQDGARATMTDGRVPVANVKLES